MHTVHFKLSTAHRTPHTAQCTLHPAHYTIHYALHADHYTMHTSHCTLYVLNWLIHNSHFTLHTAHFTMQCVDSIICTAPYPTIYKKGAHCKWHNVNFWPPNLCLMFTTHYTLDNTPYTLQIMHCNGTLCALHSANCTIHLALWANVTFSPLVWNDCKKQPVTVKCLQSCITGTLHCH